MASAAGSAIRIPARPLLSRWSQADFMISGPKLVHFATQNKSFWSIQLHSTPSRLQVSCAAKPKTVKKVCEIVMKQLALPDDSVVTGESKFSALGADSLDKLVQVEIVKGLEDAFGISVEEDVAQGIATVQDAADMIDKIMEGKSGASSETRLGISSQSVVGENDLLIVGPGVLGRIVAEKWQQDHPNCRVFGQTITTDHHDELTKVGIIPFLRGAIADHQFPFIIFCAPPSRAADYPGDVRLASSYWNGEGSFLFTSSSAVYDCNDNGVCDEDAPVVQIGKSPRTDVLLRAENAVLEVGGSVLRLAGLYKSDRGAHVYWLKKGIVDIRPDHVLNLIHYEDAASLSVAVMKKRFRNRVFMGCDNHPLSRQEVMDCVRRSGKFCEKFEGFTGTGGPLGKRMNNSRTRAEVSWEPKYASLPRFLGLEE